MRTEDAFGQAPGKDSNEEVLGVLQDELQKLRQIERDLRLELDQLHF